MGGGAILRAVDEGKAIQDATKLLNSKNSWKLLARGGFSEVYSSECNNHPAAIKLIRYPTNLKHKVQIECRSEAHILNSPEKQLKFETKTFISKCCWQGLAYLHDQQVCHKDIKPENILVSDDQTIVKLADFRMSELKKAASTQTTSLKGTCLYYPPEFATEGRILRHAKLSDVYSMGASLAELFCGQYFWCNEDQPKEDCQIMYKLILQIQTNVNGLSPVEPDCWKNVDPTIQNILIHAIATNYKERKTAREISLLFDADLVSTVAPPISVVAIEPQTSQKDVILPQSTAISSGQTLFDTPLTSNVSVTTAIIRRLNKTQIMKKLLISFIA